VTVIATPIDAQNDEVFGIIGSAGAAAVLNAFTADTLDGANATSSNTTLSVAAGSSVPNGLIFDIVTGDVDVEPGTPAGNYTLEYQLCETLNPANCDLATIFVEVIAAEIEAVDDPQSPLTGVAGNPNIGNAFDNDRLNGLPVNPTNLTARTLAPASPLVPGAPVPTLNTATGVISVSPNTPGGDYAIHYQICETANPTNCDDAFITITIIPTADLSITKTNTPGVNGEIDQSDDTVTSGDIVTYTLVVTNNGPDSIDGAIVTDNPTAGLACPSSGPVTITGSGIPGGTPTIADITGAGISLGQLAMSESTTLAFDCTVN
jgi:uncharacterized repeat protein (TIGR01451 family)